MAFDSMNRPGNIAGVGECAKDTVEGPIDGEGRGRKMNNSTTDKRGRQGEPVRQPMNCGGAEAGKAIPTARKQESAEGQKEAGPEMDRN
jgi:hypothetical protein